MKAPSLYLGGNHGAVDVAIVRHAVATYPAIAPNAEPWQSVGREACDRGITKGKRKAPRPDRTLAHDDERQRRERLPRPPVDHPVSALLGHKATHCLLGWTDADTEALALAVGARHHYDDQEAGEALTITALACADRARRYAAGDTYRRGPRAGQRVRPVGSPAGFFRRTLERLRLKESKAKAARAERDLDSLPHRTDDRAELAAMVEHVLSGLPQSVAATLRNRMTRGENALASVRVAEHRALAVARKALPAIEYAGPLAAR